MGKRSHADMEGKESPSGSSPFMPMFEQFRKELDQHHDRRERIIKASRDITAASKKIIFTLQRTKTQFSRTVPISVRTLNTPLPPPIIKSNEQFHNTITTQFNSVTPDLQSINAWRYARQISGGCQEYMEAASFQHYLTTGQLLSYEAAASNLRRLDPEGPGIGLSAEDYVLGIFDMTGELMRFAITAMATGGSLPSIPNQTQEQSKDEAPNAAEQRNVLNDLRALRSALEALDTGNGPFAKEADKKMDVMRTSVEKVERSLYGLVVRGAERPKGWMPDAEGSVPVQVES